MPLPLDYLNNEKLLEDLEYALTISENAGRAVRYALKELAEELGGHQKFGELVKHLAAERLFWSRLEEPFYGFLTGSPRNQDQAFETWVDTLRYTAQGAFDDATRDLDGSGRTLRALVMAKRKLNLDFEEVGIMPEKEDWGNTFIAHLESLRDREERGSLAALRRGAGSAPGTVAAMYPHILPWVPCQPWVEDAAYIVGSLFALNSQPGGQGNIGKAFTLLPQNESLEKRFVALLNCNREDLPNHLRQAVGLLKSKEVPIDWRQLLHDILYWDHESRFVQRQWARDFWQTAVSGTINSAEEPEIDQTNEEG
jgi:CRISPR system Cascade subunit CasB